MPTIVATTVVTFDAIDVAVFVTTFWTPPMSFEMRDWTSPVRVRVKKASESFWEMPEDGGPQVVHDALPTWLDSSVWITPRPPGRNRDRDHPAGASDGADVSLPPIASSTLFSRNAGTTPSAAEATISRSRPLSRGL